jgi:CheY-like chemotaxis protein
MKCLLVDDEPGIREGLAALLRRKGHDVRTAACCDEARDALASHAFDVVVTDWRLPDGLAATFLDTCTIPVVAVSGHPEEVLPMPAIREVLTKPVTPTRLIAAILAAGTPAAAAREPMPTPLPRDVQREIDHLLAQLPPATPVELVDDGVFVIVSAELPDGLRPAIAVRGGDLRCRVHEGRVRLDLRLCRDGRPDPQLQLVRATAPWPATEDFAVDCDGIGCSEAEFAGMRERAAALAAAGRRVHFLNLPDRLIDFAASHGKAHDMPMRDPVGPRLQAVFADLWSHP